MALSQDKAKRELERMRRSLKGWLKFRDKNDAIGLTAVEQAERAATEAPLAAKMQELLTAVYGAVALPSDARELARMILSGTAPGPQAAGILPFLLIGGLVLVFVVSSAIKNFADVAKERERFECIKKVGAFQCDTTGTLLKYGVLFGIGYIIWTKTDIQKHLKGIFGKTGRAIARRR